MTVTSEAASFIKEKLAARGTPNAALRVGIRGGKCEGFAYHVEFADDPPREKDTVVEQDGVRVFVDCKSLIFLKNSVLDFEKTILQRGLKFRNPDETKTCGCGESFSV